MRNIFIIVITFVMIIVSCSKKEAEIPSYISIKKIDLITEDTEGSNSSAFTDARITIGGQFIGTFQMPCTIPVLMHGKHDVLLRAGIKLNGSSGTRVPYSVLNKGDIYDIDEVLMDSIELIPGEVTTFNGKVKYNKNLDFTIDNFEGAASTLVSKELKKVVDGDTVVYTSELTRTNNADDVFEGKSSGVVHLTKENNTVFISTGKKSFKVPKVNNLGFNYVEVNYKTEVPLRFGLWFNNSAQSQIEEHTVRSSPDKWKKIYLNITPEKANSASSTVFGSTEYIPFIIAQLPDSMEEAYLYLDNYKIIRENE